MVRSLHQSNPFVFTSSISPVLTGLDGDCELKLTSRAVGQFLKVVLIDVLHTHFHLPSSKSSVGTGFIHHGVESVPVVQR